MTQKEQLIAALNAAAIPNKVNKHGDIELLSVKGDKEPGTVVIFEFEANDRLGYCRVEDATLYNEA